MKGVNVAEKCADQPYEDVFSHFAITRKFATDNPEETVRNVPIVQIRKYG